MKKNKLKKYAPLKLIYQQKPNTRFVEGKIRRLSGIKQNTRKLFFYWNDVKMTKFDVKQDYRGCFNLYFDGTKQKLLIEHQRRNKKTKIQFSKKRADLQAKRVPRHYCIEDEISTLLRGNKRENDPVFYVA